MNALEEFRSIIEEHWPHSNPEWRKGEMKFAPTIDAIADRIEAEYMELPKDADGEVIHVGDMVDLKYGSDKTVEVYGVNGHAVYTQAGCHGADLVKLVKPEPETIDDVRNEITKDWDYARDLVNRAYECGKRDAEGIKAERTCRVVSGCCSECHCRVDYLDIYCPVCGARVIDGE